VREKESNQQKGHQIVSHPRFSWEAFYEGLKLRDCFDGGSDGRWFGGGESSKAGWPLNNVTKGDAFTTGDQGKTTWGNVIKRFFLSSRGVSLEVDDANPLFVFVDGGSLCLESK